MQLKELKYIVALADEGSISRAAERLYMAQSSLSQFLLQYETELGISKLAIGIPSTNQQIHTDRPPLNCRDLLQKTA